MNLVYENSCVTRDLYTKRIFFFKILCITVSRLVSLPNSNFECHVTIILEVQGYKLSCKIYPLIRSTLKPFIQIKTFGFHLWFTSLLELSSFLNNFAW